MSEMSITTVSSPLRLCSLPDITRHEPVCKVLKMSCQKKWNESSFSRLSLSPILLFILGVVRHLPEVFRLWEITTGALQVSCSWLTLSLSSFSVYFVPLEHYSTGWILFCTYEEPDLWLKRIQMEGLSTWILSKWRLCDSNSTLILKPRLLITGSNQIIWWPLDGRPLYIYNKASMWNRITQVKW